MATIALRFPSVDQNGQVMKGGHCYLVFPENTITVHDLLAEKVRAEFRKARAGGIHTTTLPWITGDLGLMRFGPRDEEFAIPRALDSFKRGLIILMVDGKAATSLDQIIELNRRTGLSLVIPSKVPA